MIGVCMVDNFVFSPLIKTGQVDGGTAGFMRVFRLLKVARVARVFRLSAQLRFLVGCYLASVRVVFWSTLLLLGVCYIAAVGVTLRVGQATGAPEKRTEQYGSVFTSLASILRLVLMDGWVA